MADNQKIIAALFRGINPDTGGVDWYEADKYIKEEIGDGATEGQIYERRLTLIDQAIAYGDIPDLTLFDQASGYEGHPDIHMDDLEALLDQERLNISHGYRSHRENIHVVKAVVNLITNNPEISYDERSSNAGSSAKWEYKVVLGWNEQASFLDDVLSDKRITLTDLQLKRVKKERDVWRKIIDKRVEKKTEEARKEEEVEEQKLNEELRQVPYVKAIEEQGQEKLLGLVRDVRGHLDNSYASNYSVMESKIWKLREDWWGYISVVYNLNRVVLYLLERDHDDLCAEGIRDCERVRRARKRVAYRGIYFYRNEIRATKGLLPLISEDELPRDLFRGGSGVSRGSYDKHVVDCCRFSKTGVWAIQLNMDGWLMKIGGETSLSFPVNESIWHVPEQGLRKCISFLRDIGRAVKDGELDDEISEWYKPRYKNSMEMREDREEAKEEGFQIGNPLWR
jgi:hypothetical protein